MENIRNKEWFNDPATQDVMQVFRDEKTGNYPDQNIAWFVGGCVRDSLFGKKINDIDIATALAPERVVELFESNNFKVIPTGLAHGTVTVMARGVPFEVTTLRRDVETDGRHATVEFTDNLREDAERRDFTMNAMYANFYGDVIDFFGGAKHLEEGRVVFVGDAKKRIEEDYLRILRFFRFHAYYGQRELDSTGLAWSSLLQDGLKTISAERITSELLKMFQSPNKVRLTEVMRDMHNAGILNTVIPNYHNLTRFYDLQNMEPSPILSLVSLLPNYEPKIRETGNQMRLPAADVKRMCNTVFTDGNELRLNDPVAMRRYVYKVDIETFIDRKILLWASMKQGDQFKQNIASIAPFVEWGMNMPKMPVNGADLIARGITPGKTMGSILNQMEASWIDSDFQMTKDELFNQFFKIED